MEVKFVIIITFLATKIQCQDIETRFDNSFLGLGDNCMLKSGISGVCKADNNCDFVRKLIQQKRYKDIEKCSGFVGRNQIVCCPLSKFQQAVCKKEAADAKPVIDNKIINGMDADVRIHGIY